MLPWCAEPHSRSSRCSRSSRSPEHLNSPDCPDCPDCLELRGSVWCELRGKLRGKLRPRSVGRTALSVLPARSLCRFRSRSCRFWRVKAVKDTLGTLSMTMLPTQASKTCSKCKDPLVSQRSNRLKETLRKSWDLKSSARVTVVSSVVSTCQRKELIKLCNWPLRDGRVSWLAMSRRSSCSHQSNGARWFGDVWDSWWFCFSPIEEWVVQGLDGMSCPSSGQSSNLSSSASPPCENILSDLQCSDEMIMTGLGMS